MKKLLTFLLGMISGIVIFSLGSSFILGNKKDLKNNEYIRLVEDYRIENIGYIDRGTILKIDKGMSEGFTRYILYLNLKGGKYEVYPVQHYDQVIPYWLQPVDSVK